MELGHISRLVGVKIKPVRDIILVKISLILCP
jgi:hypothetical protein